VVHRFTISDIRTAVCWLKPHKSDGAGVLSSDYVKIAGVDCYAHFALLFNAIVVHGNLPDNFCIVQLFPYVKVIMPIRVIVLTIAVLL